VAGFGAGTGAAFSLLPAQNATGNWIKIVQRVPVRIALDPAELARNPLQIGLSMQVEVDTHERGTARMPQVAQAATSYRTDVFSSLEVRADARVHAIIAANVDSAAPVGAIASADPAHKALVAATPESAMLRLSAAAAAAVQAPARAAVLY